MQLALRAVHLALERGVDGALLLDAVQAAEALVHDLGGVVVAVAGEVGDGDARVGEGFADQILDLLRLHGHGASSGLRGRCRGADAGAQCAPLADGGLEGAAPKRVEVGQRRLVGPKAHGRAAEGADAGERDAGLAGGRQQRLGGVGRAGDQVARLVLAEERGQVARVERDAQTRLGRHLEGREREAAVGKVGAGGDASRVRAHEVPVPGLGVEVHGRRRAVRAPQRLEQRRAAEMAARPAQHECGVTLADVRSDQIRQVAQEAHGADGRRGRDGSAVGLVVKRDVARNDRHGERLAGPGDAADGADDLAHDARIPGRAEVEVVGRGERRGALGAQVAAGLDHGLHAARLRIGLDVARRHVRGENERLSRAVDAHDARAGSGRHERVGHHRVVVLLPDPLLAGVVGVADEQAQGVHRRDVGHAREGDGGRRGFPRAVVLGRLARERGERQVGHDPAAVADLEAVLGDRLADDGEVEVPALEDGAGLGLPFGPQHHEHALLAFGQHHFVGGHAGLAHGHRVEVEADPEAPLVAHLHGRAGQARGAHVLDGDDGAGGHQLQARLKEALLGERVADLDGGAQRLGALVEARRGHGRAAHPVAPRLGAEVDDGAPGAGGGGGEHGARVRDARGEGVDEDVARVAGMEAHLAAHGGHAEGVGVAADALHHAGNQGAGARMRGVAEGERVERGHGPRAHGEHVAQDAAHAGRSPLIRLDEGGVVVALHLEDDHLPVADVHHARVLSGAVDHLGA